MTICKKPIISILGGTGNLGGGLALRWAHSGYNVIVGSRMLDVAVKSAERINTTLKNNIVRGMINTQAAIEGDIVVLTVPYAFQRFTIETIYDALEDKILIDCTVPLVPPNVSRVQLHNNESAVEGMQKFLGPKTRVVSAFQNISAHLLSHYQEPIDCDVLVCSDDREAAKEVIGLAKEINLRAWDAGVLANSIVTEGLTSILISLNRRYKRQAAGIRVTGLN